MPIEQVGNEHGLVIYAGTPRVIYVILMVAQAARGGDGTMSMLMDELKDECGHECRKQSRILVTLQSCLRESAGFYTVQGDGVQGRQPA